MDIQNLRYIVFTLNPDTQQYMDGQRIDTHDGNVYSSLQLAKEYAEDSIKKKLCTRYAIGVFYYEPLAERMGITCVETFGFRNDKKNSNQLELFSKNLVNRNW